MSEELEFHMEHYADELVSKGIPKAEAVRRARLEFGGLNSVQEECREARGFRPFDELSRNVQHSVRLLWKTPGFTVAALLTLGICLGANLTIFAVIDSVLLRPLPFPDPDRLVTAFNTYPKAGVDRDGSSITNYYERRGRIPALASVAMYRFGRAVVGDAGATERESVSRVSPEFFDVLGVGPIIGRSFHEDEMTPQTNKAVILTDAFWRQQLDSDPQVVGRQIRVDGVGNTVVGVLPAGFRFLSSEARLYLPLSSRAEDRAPANRHSGGNSNQMLARLAAGATLEQAQTQIDAQNTLLERDDPQAKMMAEAGFRSLVVPLHADHVASAKPVLLCLQAGAFGLLLIGGVNLMNLLLLRAGRRVKEMAVRRALGASTRHVLNEIVVETTLLTVFGGLLGLGVGAGGIRLLAMLGTDRLPLGAYVAFDGRLAVAALAGAALLGVLLALPIAWFSLKGDLGLAIQSETRGGTSSRAAQTWRHAFIVLQIGLAMALLSGAGLLGVSLERALAVSPGFRADHVLTAQISVPWSQYGTWPARLAFNERLLQALGQQSEVVAAGIVNNLPLSGNDGKSAATVKSHVRRPGESARGNYSYGVDGDYFTAMGLELAEGRFLNSDDSRRGTTRPCVVDEDFARFYWPQGSPLGQQLFMGGEAGPDNEAFTVVGVVRAAKQALLTDESAPGAVYYPYALRTDDNLFVVIRTNLPPETVGATLRRIVREADPELPLSDVRSMATRVADSLVTYRSSALLAGLFSVIAVLLTAIGTYGVLSYAVAQRRKEIGMRMALGALPGQIRAQFLGLGVRLLSAGTVLGLAGAWAAGQGMRTLLFHVPPLNPATVIGAVAIVGLVSLVACLAPSHRAAKISPVEALADQ